MVISFVLVILIAVGGMSLTYLVADDKPLLWRLAAGNIVGAAVFGTIAFILACVVGFGPATIVGSLAITLVPIALLWRVDTRSRFRHDIAKARGKIEGGNIKKFRAFA